MFKAILVFTVLLLMGCQTIPPQPTARDLKSTPNQGGTIALHTEHSDEDRAKADLMMKKTCGEQPIRVTQEGEALSAAGTNTTTAPLKEWQISYECGKSKSKKR